MKAWTYANLYPNTPVNRRPSEPHTIRFWKIEEAVGGGNFILLPGIFMTEEAAKKAIRVGRHASRAVEYQQGRGTNGPERVT